MRKQWKQWLTIFGGSKITADGDRSHEIKRCFLLGKKVLTNLDSILKSRDITLSTKVCLVKYFLPVVMYECESWTMKKAEHRRIDAFKLWCWRKLLFLWTIRRSNQSILKKISPEYSLEGLMLKLKLQYLGHLMRRTFHLKRPWCWERLKVGWEGDDRRWEGWMASLTQWTWVCVNSRSWWWTGRPGTLRFMGSQRVGHDWATELHVKKFADSTLNVRVNIHITIEVWKYLSHKHPFSESYWRMSSAKWGSKHIGGPRRGVPETVHSTSMHCTSSPCKAVC